MSRLRRGRSVTAPPVLLQISFIDYYKKNYMVEIKNPEQPLLISRPKKRGGTGGHQTGWSRLVHSPLVFLCSVKFVLFLVYGRKMTSLLTRPSTPRNKLTNKLFSVCTSNYLVRYIT